jgi:hypothetical protein
MRLTLLAAALLAVLAAILVGSFAGAASAGQSSVCAEVKRFHLEKQMNQRAGRILAMCRPASYRRDELGPFSSLNRLRPDAPDAYGGPDINLITGGEGTPPHVVQSEVQVWANGSHVVAAYNDSRSITSSCVGGGSYSTNGGATWTNNHPFCLGRANSGDPTVVYDAAHSKWVAVFLAGACATDLGVYTSADGITWAETGCVSNVTGSGDRESMWVDNNPASPFYGRIYVSWNNFALGGGALQVSYSTDGALTWVTPITVFASFRRNVQITTSPGADGAVFIASMDEGGGGLNGPRTNYIYRSTNGGVTWSQFQTGASFLGPGRATCATNAYFAGMYTTPVSGYWRWCRPRRRRPLRLRVAAGHGRPGQHLLRALDRQRRHVECAAAGEHGLDDPSAVATFACGQRSRSSLHQLVRRAQHDRRQLRALRTAVD